jgi:hypothetical protein
MVKLLSAVGRSMVYRAALGRSIVKVRATGLGATLIVPPEAVREAVTVAVIVPIIFLTCRVRVAAPLPV